MFLPAPPGEPSGSGGFFIFLDFRSLQSKVKSRIVWFPEQASREDVLLFTKNNRAILGKGAVMSASRTVTPEQFFGTWEQPGSSSSIASCHGVNIRFVVNDSDGGKVWMVLDSYYDPGAGDSMDDPWDHHHYAISWEGFQRIVQGLTPGKEADLPLMPNHGELSTRAERISLDPGQEPAKDKSAIKLSADGKSIELSIAPYHEGFSRAVF